MCKTLEEMINQAVLEARRESAKRMLALSKLTVEEISYYTNLTIAEVEALAAQHSA